MRECSSLSLYKSNCRSSLINIPYVQSFVLFNAQFHLVRLESLGGAPLKYIGVLDCVAITSQFLDYLEDPCNRSLPLNWLHVPMIDWRLWHFYQAMGLPHVTLLNGSGKTQPSKGSCQSQNCQQVAGRGEGLVVGVSGFLAHLHVICCNFYERKRLNKCADLLIYV